MNLLLLTGKLLTSATHEDWISCIQQDTLLFVDDNIEVHDDIVRERLPFETIYFFKELFP
jgi:hypothetical protein